MTDYILNKGQLPANELAGLLETNPGNIRIATWTVAVTTCPDTANLFIQPQPDEQRSTNEMGGCCSELPNYSVDLPQYFLYERVIGTPASFNIRSPVFLILTAAL